MKTLRILTAIAAINIVSQASAIQILGDDLINGTFDVTRHERFYSGPDKDFIGASLGMSGVSRPGAWATMISDSYFLSSSHFHPSNNEGLTFHRDDSELGETWVASVVGGIQIGDTDLWLGQIDNAAPAWVHRYPLLDRPNTYNYAGNDAIDSTIYVVGREHSPNDSPDPSIDVPAVRVGRNRIDSPTGILTSGVWLSQGIRFSYDGEFAIDEARTLGGDSGGPSLAIVHNSRVGLVGTHTSSGFDVDIAAYIDDLLK